MPRHNRRDGKSRRLENDDSEADLRLELVRSSLRRTVTKRGVDYSVQNTSGTNAEPGKSWICPHCNVEIKIGTPHLVAWDSERGLATRRHFHTQCFSSFQGPLL